MLFARNDMKEMDTFQLNQSTFFVCCLCCSPPPPNTLDSNWSVAFWSNCKKNPIFFHNDHFCWTVKMYTSRNGVGIVAVAIAAAATTTNVMNVIWILKQSKFDWCDGAVIGQCRSECSFCASKITRLQHDLANDFREKIYSTICIEKIDFGWCDNWQYTVSVPKRQRQKCGNVFMFLLFKAFMKQTITKKNCCNHCFSFEFAWKIKSNRQFAIWGKRAKYTEI